ncbi:hypothetical protein [Streptomyces sp. NBC_00503]|uniref:hypothetical protein n=1 Tax=Streptomyces sp. NBC_00503 TaxID=2903659 RepID=UPI002E7FE4C7|nr:hypothetical protein [Streptomyces sp. NBC_00503]WUD83181.1 hypothetical protein OG490_22930 [Streptomyces sp. NBC_00503]
MSFGDPNNPYGQQQPQGQPGYGYPQQAPQGVPPQGYAYPQQAGYPGPAGYPGANVPMPGGVKGARVILWILGILEALGGLLVAVGGALFASAFSSSSSSSASDAGTAAAGVFVVLGILMVGISLWPILTAAKMAKGRGGVRVSGIIFGSIQTLFAGGGLLVSIVTLSNLNDSGVAPFMFTLVIQGVSLGLGLWILIGLANSAAGVYFKRPQY